MRFTYRIVRRWFAALSILFILSAGAPFAYCFSQKSLAFWPRFRGHQNLPISSRPADGLPRGKWQGGQRMAVRLSDVTT